jgi:hypothetical protein
MQRNKVHHVRTITRIAKDLGADEDLIHDLTLDLEPEDGVIWVYGLDTDGILAFTDDAIEEVQRPLDEYRHDATSKS